MAYETDPAKAIDVPVMSDASSPPLQAFLREQQQGGGDPALTELNLAHILVAKFADHLPLYRQSQIYARVGVELERSTLADWVGLRGMYAGSLAITCIGLTTLALGWPRPLVYGLFFVLGMTATIILAVYAVDAVGGMDALVAGVSARFGSETAALSVLRLRFVAWPLHPVGYLLAFSWPMKMIWFSLFVGWVAKVLLVRFGGVSLYRAARPVFIGLIRHAH